MIAFFRRLFFGQPTPRPSVAIDPAFIAQQDALWGGRYAN